MALVGLNLTTENIMLKTTKNFNLTSKEYWSKYLVGFDLLASYGKFDNTEPKHQSKFREYTRSYENYLRGRLLDRYFQYDESRSIVEVGSAPGGNLVNFHHKYGYKTFGIEYTDDGAEINRLTFKKSGIPPENVLQNDFMDTEFIDKFHDVFDIVVSFGFLEHFTNPEEVVNHHIDILKPGGLLYVTIPNFRYLNYVLKVFFGSEFISTHNLNLMDVEVFKKCFSHKDIEVLECGYFGGFQFTQPTCTKPWKRIIEKIMGKLQLFINLFFRVFFKDKGWESRYFSSHLMYIGRKRLP